MRPPLRVGIVGCGLIGRKRAEALGESDRIVGVVDPSPEAANALALVHDAAVAADLEELLGRSPDVIVIATPHNQLAPLTQQALRGGSHVLVEKPAGLGSVEVRELIAIAAGARRLVKVGFNHRFHPALDRVAQEVHSGAHGELLHVRGRYGHGGRIGYEREWRADPARSGGGELIDQGMHLLDLVHWLAGPLPLHAALLRTHFWDMPVEDNAVMILGDADVRVGPWALLHATWTEWKNLFSLEVYCQSAKLQVDGLARSYGPQSLRIYRMRPELGPPETEEIAYASQDVSWAREWQHFAGAIAGESELMGGLSDALYAWERVEEAYARTPFAKMRAGVVR
jgi:predicted dehydrogenase